MNVITIDLSPQEAFDKMVAGLKAQGWMRSMNKYDTVCKYRGDAGRKCAVGHLLTDFEAQNSEGSLVSALLARGRIRFADAQTQRLVEDCQLSHDVNPIPANMIRSFRERAEAYGLDAFKVTL